MEQAGQPLQELLPGDTVTIPPDVKHWHGSAPGYGAPSYGEPSYREREPSYGRPAAPGAISPITPWAIILLSGAGLWFINGFLPWYSFDFGGFGGGTWLGFSTGTGLFAFVMSLFILGGVITSFFVPLLVPWRWTGAFFFGLMALILLIMGMVAAFSGVGKSIGPWIHLLATLAVLTGAVLEGIFGLMAFLATMQKGGSRPM